MTSRAERFLFDEVPEGPLRSAARRALARAHRREAVARALAVAFTTIRFDAVVTLPDGTEVLDCSQPTPGAPDMEQVYDGLRLNAHDRTVVAGFVAEIEGALAAFSATKQEG